MEIKIVNTYLSSMANAFGLKPMEFSAYINSQTNNLSKNYEAFSIRILSGIWFNMPIKVIYWLEMVKL